MKTATTRRERARVATSAEIVTTARRLLIESGPQGVTLRAIAREMGMTAPGLYRYVNSHEDLMTWLIASLFDEATGCLEAARDAAEPDDVGVKMLAVCRAFRRWALANPAELALVFGSPVPGFSAPEEGSTEEAARRFCGVFLALFVELWQRQPFPVRAEAEIDPGLRSALKAWVPVELDLPAGMLELFLRCWMRLYGAVTMEGFGQLAFALEDAEPLFELELADLGEMLGVGDAYSPPGRPSAG
jgi:AcrR family transcriptional regulator